MSKKGTTSYERELSQQELDLLETQNQMMQQGGDIAQTAEDRSIDQYRQCQKTYEPIETGLIPQGATRETGYYAPPQAQAQAQGTSALFQGTPQGTATNVANTMFQAARNQGLIQDAMIRPTGRPVSQPQTWSSPLQGTPQGTAANVPNTIFQTQRRGKGA